ncbi:hypothetical protein [Streptomyces sp. NPDC056387]|uniref:hypothetical protein n=1 Tax=Streptomyces sp. NPDC056387 TaxID=3345803 RepID=UPI0035E1D959
MDWAGLTAAPTGASGIVTGRRYSALEGGGALIVADDGISLTSPRGRVTVRYADCTLLQVYPDGGRHLVGGDGFTLSVEPTLYGITGAELTRLDAGVPAASVVRMPPRDADRIPQPRKRARNSPPDVPVRRAWFTVLLWVLGIPAVSIGGYTALLAYVATQGPRDHRIAQEDARFLFACMIVSAVFLIPWGLLVRRRKEGRS